MGHIKREVDISDLEKGWHHVFATYDGSGKARGTCVYIDGKSLGTIRYDGLRGTLQNNVPLFIGRRSETDQYRGRIDDVRIYDRILPPQEVQQLYQHGLHSVNNIPVDKRTADQKDLLRRVSRENENSRQR